jgi:hypothetical protein
MSSAAGRRHRCRAIQLTDGGERSVIDDETRRGNGRPVDDVLAGRREQLDHLRRVAVLVETAAVLDDRASRSANAAYAGVLRERAAQRRRTADRVRAGVLGPDHSAAG